MTIPGIRPTLTFTLIMIMIWSFLVFDYIFLLTQGGPAHSSEVLATLVYDTAFHSFRVGYATAISLTMTVFSAIFISLFRTPAPHGMGGLTCFAASANRRAFPTTSS